jgi:hypothetical protein
MKSGSLIVVVFDQIGPDDFFHRLEWDGLIGRWSGAIAWSPIGAGRVRLELAGVDGLEAISVARRRVGDRVFIAARDGATGELIQTGVWAYDRAAGTAWCVRRVHRPELVEPLRRRLPDFCCAAFLRGGDSQTA